MTFLIVEQSQIENIVTKSFNRYTNKIRLDLWDIATSIQYVTLKKTFFYHFGYTKMFTIFLKYTEF